MFELALIANLTLSEVDASERINMFCARVVGVPYATGNITDEEWERFVYCREGIRVPQ